jgi:hypothetical protein
MGIIHQISLAFPVSIDYDDPVKNLSIDRKVSCYNKCAGWAVR